MLGDEAQTSLEERVRILETQLASLKGDASVGQILGNAKFSLKWPARIQGPNGDAYIIIREPEGWLSTVPAATFEDSDWNEGTSSLDLTVADLTADSLTVEDITTTDDLTVGGSLAVTDTAGEATFEGYVEARADLGVIGTAKIGEALTAGGAVIFNDTLAVNSTLAVGGTSQFYDTITATQINFTGDIDGSATSDLYIQDANIEGALRHSGSTIGFFNVTPSAKKTVTGSRGGNAALASLLTQLANYGEITDNTTA